MAEEEKDKGFDGQVSLDHYPTEDEVKALDGVFKGTMLEKAPYTVKAAAIATSLMGGPGRIGFDNRRMFLTEGLAEKHGLGGYYDPKQDFIVVDPEHYSSATHESIHRGLKLMMDHGKIGGKGDYEKASKDDLEKQVWLAKNDRSLGRKDHNEELLVRSLMRHNAGDPEHTEYADELRPDAEKLYYPERTAWWQDAPRDTLPDAAGEIDKRSTQMLVEQMKDGTLPWFMRSPKPQEIPIPQRKPSVPAFAKGGLVGDDEAEFQDFYGRLAKELHLDPNPDDPEHHYDYRAWYHAAKRDPKRYSLQRDKEDGLMHFPSEFKADDHPNRFVKQDGGLLDSKYEKMVPIPQHKPAFAAGGLVGHGVPQPAPQQGVGLGGQMPAPAQATLPTQALAGQAGGMAHHAKITPGFAAGGPVDPPPGALPEEVADDVDAKLSKGEYVIPADVVRYMGLEKIEQIVHKAKEGLMAMQHQGRIQDAPPPPGAPAPQGQAPAQPAPAPAPQGKPPGFAAGGMVGDLYSNTFNQYQQRAGNSAPTIETYVDENGRLAYRYVDAKGRPIGQPKVTMPNQVNTGTGAGTGTATNTNPTLTNPGTLSPVAPGLKTNPPGHSGDGDGSNGGLGNTGSSDPRDTPGNYNGSFSDFMGDVAAGMTTALGGPPGMMAGAYGLATTGKPMTPDQALGISMPNLGIMDYLGDKIDTARGYAQYAADPKYNAKAPETILEDGTRIKWSQPVTPLNDPSSNNGKASSFSDSLGGHYNADGTYTDKAGKTSAVGPASAVQDYQAAHQALPDAVAARAGLASADVGGTNYGGPSSMPNSIGDRGAMSAADLAQSYANSLASTPSTSGGYGLGSIADSFNGGWGGVTSASPGTAGRGGGADGNNGAGGSSDSRVICTHFYQKGELARDLWVADTRWTMEHVSLHTQRGYHIWSIPYVRLMRKSKLAEAIMRPLAINRAEQVGYLLGMRDKPNNMGRLGRVILEGVSWIAGCLPITPESYKKLYSK